MEHAETEGLNTGTCEYCGNAFPIISESRGTRKYCSHDCYIKARFHTEKPENYIQSTEENPVDTCSDESISAPISLQPKSLGKKTVHRLGKYEENPYVRVNVRGRLVVNNLFYSAAMPFCDLPVTEILRIFEIDPLEFKEEELQRIRSGG